MGELTIMADGRVALSGPHRSDPVLAGTLGRHVFHLGVDLGQTQDPTALSVIEDRCYPLAEYDAGGQQLLGERQFPSSTSSASRDATTQGPRDILPQSSDVHRS